jgi:hypothetical protein
MKIAVGNLEYSFPVSHFFKINGASNGGKRFEQWIHY